MQNPYLFEIRILPKGIDVDEDWKTLINNFKEEYKSINPLYNQVRNYVAKKSYKDEKLKLTFDRQTLADGFDANKESDNGCVILIKEGKYYLGVMLPNHNTLFQVKTEKELEGNGYLKMNYKYFPDPSQMIPKCSTQLKEVKNHFKDKKTDKKILVKNLIKKLL